MNNSRAFGVASLMTVVASMGAIGWAGYNLLPKETSKSAPAVPPTQSSPSLNASQWIGVLGIDADALAAAGVSAEGAATVRDDLQGFMNDYGEPFIAAIHAHNAAIKQADADQRMIRAGKPPADDLLTLHGIALSTASTERSARQAAAMEAALTHLSEQQKNNLRIIRDNAGRDVPPAYCLTPRKDAQWVALRDALAAERQAAERGERLSGSAQELLVTIRAEPSTSVALNRTATNGAAVKQALR
jgi:hypothetical protein